MRNVLLRKPVLISLVGLASLIGLAIWLDNLDKEILRAIMVAFSCGVVIGIMIGAVTTALITRPGRGAPRFEDRPRTRPSQPVMFIQPRPGEGPEVRWPEAQRWTPAGGPPSRTFKVIGEDYTEG